MLWNLWLDRNRIIFNGGQVQDVHIIGAKILAVARFWALHQKSDLTSQLNLIFPCDLKDLIGSTLVVSMVGTQVSIPMLGAGINSNGGDDSSTEDSDGCDSLQSYEIT